MRNMSWVKWAVYAACFILVAVLQFVRSFPQIFHVTPLFLIPAVITVAMFEGEMAGAVYGVFAGLLWDASAGRIFGFNGFFLMIVGLSAGLLVTYVFRNTMVSSVLLTGGFTLLLEILTWFFFYYITGLGRFAFFFPQVILPTVLYTLPFAIPLFYGARQVNRKLTFE